MNDEVGILSTQAEAMLTELRRHGLTQVNELIDTAQERAQETIREAHRSARRAMHEAVEAERKRLERGGLMARAAQQTRLRLHREAKAKLLLHQGWQKIPEVLKRQWEDAPSRRQWCEAFMQQALKFFGSVRLIVEHSASMTEQEKRDLHAVATSRGADVTFNAADDRSSGLIVSFKGASLDGTIDGLLADRRYVEARLLDEINRVRASAEDAEDHG